MLHKEKAALLLFMDKLHGKLWFWNNFSRHFNTPGTSCYFQCGSLQYLIPIVSFLFFGNISIQKSLDHSEGKWTSMDWSSYSSNFNPSALLPWGILEWTDIQTATLHDLDLFIWETCASDMCICFLMKTMTCHFALSLRYRIAMTHEYFESIVKKLSTSA